MVINHKTIENKEQKLHQLINHHHSITDFYLNVHTISNKGNTKYKQEQFQTLTNII